jgi:hypothetical protein
MWTTWLSDRAISISVPTPLPLSTMPGPLITESRCAPIVTIRFGLPPRVRDHVRRLANLGQCLHDHVHDRRRSCGVERLPEREVDPEHRDRDRSAERSADGVRPAFGAVVEDQNADRAGRRWRFPP